MEQQPEVNQEAFKRAQEAGAFLLKTFNTYECRPMALIVGSGWDHALRFTYDSCCRLEEVPGLEAFVGFPEPGGYKRTIRLFMHHETPIYVITRVNPFDDPASNGHSLPRLATEMLFHAGVRDLVCLGSFGALVEPLELGDICTVSKFIDCKGYPVPYLSGDKRTNAGAGISKELIEYARSCTEVCLTRRARHYIVRGPQTESITDKGNMAREGAHVVGNSGQLDAWLSSLYSAWDIRFLMLGIVTTAYGQEYCAERQKKVTARYGDRMGKYLQDFLAFFPRRSGDEPDDEFSDEEE